MEEIKNINLSIVVAVKDESLHNFLACLNCCRTNTERTIWDGIESVSRCQAKCFYKRTGLDTVRVACECRLCSAVLLHTCQTDEKEK